MSIEEVKAGFTKFFMTEVVDNMHQVMQDPNFEALLRKGETMELNFAIKVPKETVQKLLKLL